jgi:glycerol-3-phosphate dehydrogenase
MSLIGTTDDVVDGSPDDGDATAADIDRLQAKIARLLPSAKGRLFPLRDSYGALRALPGKVGDSYFASREDTIADHARDGAAGFLSVFGGKWTTARMMAEKAVDRLPADVLARAKRCDTASAPLPDAPPEADAFREEWRGKLPAWRYTDVDTWVGAYGTALPGVLSHLSTVAAPDFKDREEARFAYAVADEMAVLPGDIVHRLGRWYRIANPGVHARASEWLAARAKVADAGDRSQGQGAG